MIAAATGRGSERSLDVSDRLSEKLSERLSERVCHETSDPSGILNASKYTQINVAAPESDGAPAPRSCCSSCWSRYEEVKNAVRVTLDEPDSGPCASMVHHGVVVLILASTILALLSTVKEFTDRYPVQLDFLEMAFTACFTLEIVMRLWTRESCAGYFLNVSNLVDIVATLPWYLEQAIGRFAPKHLPPGMSKIAGPMRTLRMVRLVRMIRLLRVLRLAKAARHSETITTVFESIADSLEGIFVLICMVTFGSILPATLMYAIESEEEPGKFTSIPQSMWWAMATITTVGYGDVVPSSTPGKAIACCTMVIGMIIVSISVAAITTSFTESYNRRMQMVRMQKHIKKARQSQCGYSSDDSLMGEASPITPRSHVSNFSLRTMDREKLDLLTMFGVLEDDTRLAMLRLEQTVHGRVFNSEDGSAPPPRKASFRARSSINVLPKADPNLIAFQVLQEQSHAFFKAVTAFAEALSESEAERPSNGRASVSAP